MSSEKPLKRGRPKGRVDFAALKRKAADETESQREQAIAREEIVLADKSKLRDSAFSPHFPDSYEAIGFTCRDCGRQEVWTAAQQKLWYEEWGGLLDSTAVRCRECRKKERTRKSEARRIHQEGVERKRSAAKRSE